MMENQIVSKIKKITLVGFWINLALVILKLFFGYWGQSDALVADGYHSLSDFFTDFIVIFCVSIAYKKADSTHPYGHGKYETLSTLIIGITLLFVAIYIGYEGIATIWKFMNGVEILKPNFWTIIIALLSIGAKEFCYQYTVKEGKKINSSALMANAWHHRSDAFSSIATLIGVSISYFFGESWRVMDPIASVLIAVFIGIAAIKVTKPSFRELLEGSLPEDDNQKILNIISSVNGVNHIHNLRTRKNGYNPVIDVNIHVNPEMSVLAAHEISNQIEEKIKQAYNINSIIYVHIEPDV